METIIFASLVWLVSVVAGTTIGARKGNPASAFLLCALLGPLGLVLCLASGDANRKPCPHCAEPILKKAIVCPHCRLEVADQPSAGPEAVVVGPNQRAVLWVCVAAGAALIVGIAATG